MCTTFDNYFTFSRSSDMIGTHNILMGVTWPEHALIRDGLLSVSGDFAHSTCASNLKSLWSPITKTHKATQNVESGVLEGGYGSPKVIGNVRYDTIRYDTVELRALKSWRDGQLNLAHGPETKNNEKK